MSSYDVHFGLELPFWLALPNGSFDVADGGERHRFNLSNSVYRLDVGDFFLAKQEGLRRQWVESEYAEIVRGALQKEHPTMPITQHATKTFLTHVRKIEAAGLDELTKLYEQSRESWYQQTLQLVNKIIESYMVITVETPGHVGPVASWDIGSVLVSFWDVTGMPPPKQVIGVQLYVRPADTNSPPAPMANDRRLLFEESLLSDVPLPVVDLLFIGAGSQITRGRYRNAIVDDVTAFELEVAQQAERLLTGHLPESIIEKLTDQRFDDLCAWLDPLGGPAIKQLGRWPDAQKARAIRKAVVHDGAAATEEDARFVHEVVGVMLNALRGML